MCTERLSEDHIPYSVSETIRRKFPPHVHVLHLNTEFSLSNYTLDGLKKSWTGFCHKMSQYFKTLLMGAAHKKQNLGWKFFQSLHCILKHVRILANLSLKWINPVVDTTHQNTLKLWPMPSQASGTGLRKEVRKRYLFVNTAGTTLHSRTVESYGCVLWGSKAWNPSSLIFLKKF